MRLAQDAFAAFFLKAARSVVAGTPHPFLIFEARPFEGEYVQFKLFGDNLVGEVGSLEWTDDPHPFSALARGFLAASGFVGGGPDRNYVCQWLPLDAAYLAGLVEMLFTVYELDEGYDLVVKAYYGEPAA